MSARLVYYTMSFLLVIGFLIRVLLIDSVPSRLTVDEMSLAYNAYSLLQTGKDEWGRKFPLVFEAFGDFKLPLYIYLSMPFISLLGLTFLSTKFVSILSGVGFIVLAYLIGTRISNDNRVGIASAFVATFSPWSIFLSRQALESHLALLLFCVGFYFLLPFGKKPLYSILSGLFFGLTLWTYVAYRMLLVLLMPVFLWFIQSKKQRFLFLGIFVLAIIPIFHTFFSPAGLARARQTSLFTDEGIASWVNENRAFCHLVEPRLSTTCALFFNKGTQFLDKWIGQYFSFFSPEFLFLSGDKNTYLNHPDFGEFLWWGIPILFFGIKGFWRLPQKNRVVVFALTLLSPLPASLSGSAQMVRSSLLLLPLVLVLGVGLSELWRWIGSHSARKLFRVGLMLMLLFFNVRFLISYFVIYPAKYDNASYQLSPQIAHDLALDLERYTAVYFHHSYTDAHMYLAYFLSIDPQEYQKTVVRPIPDSFGFSHPTDLGKFHFGIQSFEELFCADDVAQFAYIAREPVVVNVDGKMTSYSTREYRNFSGVHVQSLLIDSTRFEQFLLSHELDRKTFCTH